MIQTLWARGRNDPIKYWQYHPSPHTLFARFLFLFVCSPFRSTVEKGCKYPLFYLVDSIHLFNSQRFYQRSSTFSSDVREQESNEHVHFYDHVPRLYCFTVPEEFKYSFRGRWHSKRIKQNTIFGYNRSVSKRHFTTIGLCSWTNAKLWKRHVLSLFCYLSGKQLFSITCIRSTLLKKTTMF